MKTIILALTFLLTTNLLSQNSGSASAFTLKVELGNKTELPSDIFVNTQIETLKISGGNFSELHRDIRKLYNLRALDLSETSVDMLPEELSQLRRLDEIYLPYNNWWYRADELRIKTRAKVILCN